MKEKSNTFTMILPALAAGLLFIFCFAFLRLKLIISLIISVIVLIVFTLILYIPSKKKIPGVSTSYGNQIKNNLDNAKVLTRKLTQFNFRIENKKITEDLKIIVSNIEKIIKIVEENPLKYKRASKYLNYYPETTIKILDQYDRIENDRLQGSEALNFMKKVEVLVSRIKSAYDTGLNDLYSDDILDSSADLKVLESDLNNQIGSFKNDFNL